MACTLPRDEAPAAVADGKAAVSEKADLVERDGVVQRRLVQCSLHHPRRIAGRHETARQRYACPSGNLRTARSVATDLAPCAHAMATGGGCRHCPVRRGQDCLATWADAGRGRAARGPRGGDRAVERSRRAAPGRAGRSCRPPRTARTPARGSIRFCTCA
jgi:hypothetical protein